MMIAKGGLRMTKDSYVSYEDCNVIIGNEGVLGIYDYTKALKLPKETTKSNLDGLKYYKDTEPTTLLTTNHLRELKGSLATMCRLSKKYVIMKTSSEDNKLYVSLDDSDVSLEFQCVNVTKDLRFILPAREGKDITSLMLGDTLNLGVFRTADDYLSLMFQSKDRKVLLFVRRV